MRNKRKVTLWGTQWGITSLKSILKPATLRSLALLTINWPIATAKLDVKLYILNLWCLGQKFRYGKTWARETVNANRIGIKRPWNSTSLFENRPLGAWWTETTNSPNSLSTAPKNTYTLFKCGLGDFFVLFYMLSKVFNMILWVSFSFQYDVKYLCLLNYGLLT